MNELPKRLLSLAVALVMVLGMVPFGGLEGYAAEEETSYDLVISTADELKAFADEVNAGNSYEGKTVGLANDIDMEYTAVVIGTEANPFKGTFDGQNYTVSNLTVYEDGSESDYFADSDDCIGLFGCINTPAVIKNVTVHDPYLVGSSYVGGIVGMAYTGRIENCHITGEIDIEGFYMVGGITGHGYAKISDCSVIGEEGWDYSYVGATYKESDLEGDNVGGIVGHNAENNDITNCTVGNITVSGTRKVGGIVGITAQSTRISGCSVTDVTVETTATAEYATSKVTTMSIGGIVGQYMADANGVGGTLSDCSVSGLTFANENNVAVNAGALTGGVRASSGATTEPAEGNLAISENAVTAVSGDTVTYLEPEVSAVAEVGGVEYPTLEAAIAAADGKTVTLLTDITSDMVVIEAGKTVTVDMAGHDLTAASDSYALDVYGKLILTGTADSVVTGGICINDENSEVVMDTVTVQTLSTDMEGMYNVLNYGGKFTMNSGKLYVANDADSVLIALWAYGGTSVINGGQIVSGDTHNKAGDDAVYAILATSGANVTIGNATVTGAGGAICSNSNATVTVEGGTFTSGLFHAAYGGTGAVVINGGTFIGTLNGNVTAQGGSYTYDVSDHCTDGYSCVKNAEGQYTVARPPKAEVTVMGGMTLTQAEHNYMVWPSGDATIDRPLEILMNFKALETEEEAAAGAFGSWNTDFYVTVEGLEADTIIADGCYLAGNYGEFGWIVIPMDGAEVANGVANPIVSMYDPTLNYKDICGSVKDFTAAIHVAPEILEDNPNMTVKLELKMTNPVDETDTLVVGEPAVYDVETLKNGIVAQNMQTGACYSTLQAALGDAQTGDTVKLLADSVVSSQLSITEAVTIDGNGYSIIADENTTWYTTSGTVWVTKKYAPWVVLKADGIVFQNITIDANGCAGGVKVESAENVVFDDVSIIGAQADALTVDGSVNFKTYLKVDTTSSIIDARSGVVTAEAGTEFDMTKWNGNVSPATSDLKGVVDSEGNPFFCAYGSTTYYTSLNNVATTIKDLTLLDDVELSSNITLSGTVNLNGHDLSVAEGKTVKIGSNTTITGEGALAADLVLTSASATLEAPEDLDVTTTVADSRVVYENGVYSVEAIVYVAQLGEAKYETVAEALEAAKTAGMTDVVITLIGETAKESALALEDTFDLYTVQLFDSVTIKQEDASKVYYIDTFYTGSRTNGGKFIFDGVNLHVLSQYIFEGEVALTNNSVIKSSAEANCFIYNGSTTVEPGSKLYGVIEDLRGGDLIVDGGRTDGEYNTAADMQDAIMVIRWSGDSLTLKNGAYVNINSANEVGRLTVSANTSLNMENSKLDAVQWINVAGTVNIDLNSLITTGKITGAGKIVVDAADFSGEDTAVIQADMSGFTGTVEVAGASYEITESGLVIVESPCAHFETGAYANHAANKPRDHLGINIYDINVKESLVVKIYDENGVHIATTSLRTTDRDDGTVWIPGKYVKLTMNTVVDGKLAGAWDTEWIADPSVANIPKTFEVYADGTLTDIWEDGFTSEAERIDYIALAGVYKAASVTSGETVSYYASVQAAVDASAGDDTITLLTDITLSEGITVPSGKTVTLDLNGKTVSYNSDLVGEAMITNKGELTVTDSTEEQSGRIVYTYTGAADTSYSKGNYTISNVGTLTLNAGTVENATAKMSHACYAVDNNSSAGTATLTVNGGKILNTNNYAVRQFASGSQTNTVTVNGGEVVGTRAVWMQAAGSSSGNAPQISLSVTGGKLDGTGESDDYKLAVYSYSYGDSMQNMSITVSGGEIVGDIATTGGRNKNAVEAITITGGILTDVYSYGADEKAVEAITITGGTFATNYAEMYALDDGYVFAQNEQGTYSVEEGNFEAYYAEGNAYGTVTDVLATAYANGGGIVKLMTDVTVNGRIDVDENVTLDLNGYTLEATGRVMSLYGNSHIIDSSEDCSGVLKVAKKNLYLLSDNKYLPVKTGEGEYHFTYVSVGGALTYPAEGKVKAWLWENSASDCFLAQQLADGGKDNDVTIKFRVDYKTAASKETISADFPYSDAYVAQYGNGWGGSLTMVLKNIDSLEELEITPIFCFDDTVEVAGETMIVK